MNQYGCNNREPFKRALVVQAGYKKNGTRSMIEVPFTSNDVCNYTATAPGLVDPRCDGCKHKTR
jgi:hypothetical protein